MWGVLAGAASRAQNLASNVKNALLDEHGEKQLELDEDGTALDYRRNSNDPLYQTHASPNGDADETGELPPVSSRALDNLDNSLTDSPAAAPSNAAPFFSQSLSTATPQPSFNHPPLAADNPNQASSHFPLDYLNADSVVRRAVTPPPEPDPNAVIDQDERSQPAARSPAGQTLGVGRVLGSATTTAASTLSFFTQASSVLQKVATHVAGAEEAAESAKHKPQVELLKQQLIEVTLENDGLNAEVARLRRALEEAEDSAELLQAQSQTAALLRSELTAEQRAHEATRVEMEGLADRLRQAEQQLERNSADVAQHDSFWKAELQQQREAAVQAQGRVVELEAIIAQLRTQLQQLGSGQGPHDRKDTTAAAEQAATAAAAAAGRITALDAQLSAAQMAADAAKRRAAMLDANLAEARSAAAAAEVAATANLESQLAAVRSEAAEITRRQAAEHRQALDDAAAELQRVQQQVAATGQLEAAEASARADAAEARAAQAQALEATVRQELAEATSALAAAREELRVTTERATADGEAVAQLRARLAEVEVQVNEQREAAATAEKRADEAEAAAAVARGAAATAAAAVSDNSGGDDDGPLASMREQLEMMKELFEEEQRFGLQHKQQLEEERTNHAATRGRLAEVEAEVRQLQSQLAAAVSAQTAEVQRLRSALTEAEERATELEKDLEAAGERLREMQEAQERQSQAVAAAAVDAQADALRRCQAAEAATEAAAQQLEAAQAAAELLRGDLAAVQTERDGLSEQLAALLAERDTLRRELAEQQVAVEAAQRQGAAVAASESAEWQSKLAAASEVQALAAKQVSALKEQLVALSEQASGLTEQLQAEREGRAAEETRVQQLNEQLFRAQADLHSARQQVEAAARRQSEVAEAAATAAQETVRHLNDRLTQECTAREELARRAEAAEATCRRLQEALDAAQTAERIRASSSAEQQQQQLLVTEQLAAASQRMKALQIQVAQLQHELDEQSNRSQTVLQERDMFWKRELADRAVAVAELERALKAAEEQAARDADSAQDLRSELERLRTQSAAAATTAAATEAALRREVEVLQAAYDRAAHSTAFAYGDHDSHAEKELAAARAEVLRLQAEGRRLQGQLESAHAASTAASAEASRSALEARALSAQLAAAAAERDAATAELRQLSHVYHQHLAQQREEMAAVVAASASVSAVASASPTPRLVSRQQSVVSPSGTILPSDSVPNTSKQLTPPYGEPPTATSTGGTLLPGSHYATGGDNEPATAFSNEGGRSRDLAVPAADVAALEVEVTELRAALEAAEGERDRLKGQLVRLKAQMLREQEEEEDKVGWRVEAEVRAAEERHAAQLGALREELAATRAATAKQQTEVAALTEALELKDTEIQNLQAALGELTYESEAAEKLRLEVRAAANRVARLQQELAGAQAAMEAVEAQRKAAEHAVQQTRAALSAATASEARTADECAMLRRALDQAVAQAAAMSSETNGMVDRRIMGKLLLTYFQRNHSKEVLQLMARMLNMSEADRAALGLLGTRRGLLSRVAGAPLALMSGAGRMLTGTRAGVAGTPGGVGGPGGGAGGLASGDSLADQWVQFLLSQDEAAQRQQAALELQQQQKQMSSAQGQGQEAAQQRQLSSGVGAPQQQRAQQGQQQPPSGATTAGDVARGNAVQVAPQAAAAGVPAVSVLPQGPSFPLPTDRPLSSSSLPLSSLCNTAGASSAGAYTTAVPSDPQASQLNRLHQPYTAPAPHLQQPSWRTTSPPTATDVAPSGQHSQHTQPQGYGYNTGLPYSVPSAKSASTTATTTYGDHLSTSQLPPQQPSSSYMSSYAALKPAAASSPPLPPSSNLPGSGAPAETASYNYPVTASAATSHNTTVPAASWRDSAPGPSGVHHHHQQASSSSSYWGSSAGLSHQVYTHGPAQAQPQPPLPSAPVPAKPPPAYTGDW